METDSRHPVSIADWKAELADSFDDPDKLLRFLELKTTDFESEIDLRPGFPFRVPRNYAQRMEKGNPFDPLLLQVLPFVRENQPHAGYSQDPVQDLRAVVARGALQKYRHRLLLISTGACAIHCRYCFRRHFPYTAENAGTQQWQQALEYLRAHRAITEVILSGGDPLVLSDRRLAGLCRQIAAVEHVERLRIHTRFPIVVPSRITTTLLELLGSLGKPVAFVIHCNHANELGNRVAQALQKLRRAGVILLNQSVLLRGVNDHADTLKRLSEALFAAGVLPYYLHLPDPVAGTAHFDVNAERATRLLSELTAALPGYLVPKLVKEIAGAASKLPVGPPPRGGCAHQ